MQVVAAILRYKDKFLLSQRKEGQSYANLWEFPGGKVEKHENLHQALQRELKEELDIELTNLPQKPYFFCNYQNLSLYFFMVNDFLGVPKSLEGQNFGFFCAKQLEQLEFPPADKKLVKKLIKEFS